MSHTLTQFAGLSAFAAGPYYWDNLSGAGFGTAGGTWSSSGNTGIPGWSTDSTAAADPSGTITTATSDTSENFGSSTAALAAGTVTVSGAVNSGNIVFGSASGAITISGGTSITLPATATIAGNNAADTISSVLAGAGSGLTKLGTNNLTLNGSAVNTFTGGLNISAGTLTLDYLNLATPTDLVNGGNTLTLGSGTLNITGKNVAAATTSQTFASTTLGAGVNTINIAKGALATSATLNLGAVTVNTGDVTTFSPTTAWTTTASTTEIAKISAGGSVPSLPTGATTAFVNAGAFHRAAGGATGSLRLAAVNSSGQLLLKGNAGNVATTMGIDALSSYQWSASSSLQLTGSSSIYGLLLNGNSDFLTLTVANSGTLTLNSVIQIKSAQGLTIAPGTGTSTVIVGSEKNLVIAMDNSSFFNITAPIVDNGLGASGVTIFGSAPTGTTPGTVTFSGANTFSGQLSVLNDQLNIGSINNDSANGVLGNSALSVILGGANGVNGTLGFTAASGSSTKKFTLANGGTGTFSLASPNVLTLSGQIDGGGSLIKNNTGTLTLSGTNTYTGGTTINASGGTLQIGSAGQLNSGSYAGAISLGSSSTLKYSSSADQTLSGIISGAGALTKDTSSTSTLTLSGNNTYSGATTVNAGTLSITAGYLATATTINVASGATLTSSANNTFGAGTTSQGGAWTIAGTINGSSGVDQIMPASVTLNNGTMGGAAYPSYGTFLCYTAPTTITANGSGNTITAGNIGDNNALTFSTPLATDALSVSGYLGASSALAGSVTKSGAGTLTLSGPSIFTGGLTVSGGTLNFPSDGTSGGQPLGAYPGSVSAANVTISGGGTLNCTASSGTQTIAANRGITLGTGGGRVDCAAGGTLAINSLITGSTGLTKGTNGGTVTLGAGSAYTGATTINGGTLAISSSGEIYTGVNSGGSVTVNSGATLQVYSWSWATLGSIGAIYLPAPLTVNGGTITYTGVGENNGVNNGENVTIGTGGATLNAAGSGTWHLNHNSTNQLIGSGLTLTLTGSSNGQIDNVLTGAGALAKSGSGTWILSGVNTYTGDTTINASGGTLQIGSAGQLNSGSYAGTVSIGSGSTFKYSSSASQTLSGNISGSGALTKDTSSASTLTLSGTVSYGGATTVSAGTLIVPSTHSGTGAASVSANATLGVTVSGTSQWKPASLSLANPCTLTFSSAQNSGTTTAPILPTAAVGAVSGVAVKVSSISGTASVGNSYPLLGGVSSTTGYSLNTQPVGVVGHLAVNGTTLVYVVDTVSDIWAGTDVTQPTYWNIGTSLNWTGYAVNNSPAYTFAQNDFVLFDDTATPASPVSVALQAAVTPSAVTFNNGTKSYTVTSSGGNMIGGSGSLTLNNSGKVILAGGTNGYSGGTILNAGTLEADATGVLSTGLVTLSGGALSNNVSATLANPINLSSAATIGVGSSQTLTLSSAVTNTGALTKQGAGTLTLSGNNNFSGAVAVNAGTLNFSGGTNNYGSSSINVNNQLAQSSTLQFSGGSFTAGGSAGTRNLNLISNATCSVSGSASVTLPGIISLGTFGAGSSGNLTLSGGTLNINGYDSVNQNRALIIGEYSSETSTFTMSGGTLNVPNGKTFVGWTGTGIWNLYGGTANVQSVVMSDPAAILTLTNGQLNIGSGGVSGIGTIYLGGGTVSSAANWSTINNATLTNLNGNVHFAPASGQTITWGGVLSGSTGGLNVTGPGTLTLTNVNTYTGNTTVSAGTLKLSGSGSINNSPAITVAGGATLDASGATSFALASGQVLSNSASATANLVGPISTDAGTMAVSFVNGTPSFTVTGGDLNLLASTIVVINNTGATLTPGTYLIISQSGSGAVAGTAPTSVSVNNGPAAGTPSLSIVGGQLYLTVGGTSTFGYTGASFTYNGSGQSPAISFSGSAGSQTTNYVGTGLTTYASVSAPTNVGTYYVSNTVAADANYFGATNSQSFTIAPAALGITANDASKSYGQTVTFVGTEFASSGLVSGDSVSSVTLTSVGATNTAVVGSYAIIASTAVGSGLGNYAISYTNGTLTVNPASTSVGASSTNNPSGYKDSVAFVATVPTDATSVVVFSSPTGPFSTNSLSGGTATSLSITNLPRGTNVITVAYSGDSNYLGSTNTLNQIVTNHPPVANPATYTRNAVVQQIKIAVTNLLANATDVDDDSLTLVSVGATTNNATILISGGYVMYYNTNVVADEFTYKVSDGFGGTNSATVTLAVDSTPLFGQTTIPAVDTTSGTAALNFAGIPTYSYSVNRSTNLTDWATIWTTNAPTGGVFQFIDTSAPMPSAYYRLQYNP